MSTRGAGGEVDERIDQPYGPTRNGRQTFTRRCLRRTIHFLAYHFILTRRGTRETRAAGFRLIVPPTVFHPKIFLTSEFFAGFIDGLELKGKSVAEVGTGSGILALAAARAGAERVVAVDINPSAATAARENARLNGVGDHVVALCSNLLSAVAPRPLFDVVLSSPPSFPGEPKDLADRAWFAGPGYRDIAALFAQAGERLKPDGRFYLLLSSDSDFGLLGNMTEAAGFTARLVAERSLGFESFLLYELRPQRAA